MDIQQSFTIAVVTFLGNLVPLETISTTSLKGFCRIAQQDKQVFSFEDDSS